MPATTSWGIVGGGIVGMFLAHRLAQKGYPTTLFEASSNLGGLAGSRGIGNITWDQFYHVFLLSDSCLCNLLEELGLEKEVKWVESRTGFYIDGRFYSMSDTVEFLRFPPLNPLERMRLGATVLLASKVKNWKRLDGISASDWLMRWSGKASFEKLWLPLLRSKLGESYQQVSAVFIWATINRMYAARRTGLKKEMFGYVSGGYNRILGRFKDVLEEEGVSIRTEYAVEKIEQNNSNRVAVLDRNGREQTFDRVVMTVPFPLVPQICRGLTEEEKSDFSGIQYVGVVCALFLLKKSLSEFYITNLIDASIPFSAVIEMSSLADRVNFDGASLVYLPKYVAPDDAIFSISDDEIKDKFFPALKKMHPGLNDRDLLSFEVSRARYVFALPTLNISRRELSLKTSIPGLLIVGSGGIHNATQNINAALRFADGALSEVLS